MTPAAREEEQQRLTADFQAQYCRASSKDTYVTGLFVNDDGSTGPGNSQFFSQFVVSLGVYPVAFRKTAYCEQVTWQEGTGERTGVKMRGQERTG